MKSASSLKPHDVVLLLKILSKDRSDWRQIDIALDLEISQGEVAKSLARLRKSGFLAEKRVNRSALIEFLIHGLKYTFPADIGSLTVGVPTAISSPIFKNKIIQSEEDVYVWPSSKGDVRGQAVFPLYAQLANVVLKDEQFYELLSLVEVLRIGRTRERKIAEEEIKKRIKST